MNLLEIHSRKAHNGFAVCYGFGCVGLQALVGASTLAGAFCFITEYIAFLKA